MGDESIRAAYLLASYLVYLNLQYISLDRFCKHVWYLLVSFILDLFERSFIFGLPEGCKWFLCSFKGRFAAEMVKWENSVLTGLVLWKSMPSFMLVRRLILIPVISISVFKPDELRQALMPTLEKLYRQDPESLPFRQPVDPVLLAIPVWFSFFSIRTTSLNFVWVLFVSFGIDYWLVEWEGNW